jgi:hypothetical protein
MYICFNGFVLQDALKMGAIVIFLAKKDADGSSPFFLCFNIAFGAAIGVFNDMESYQHKA